MSYRATIMQTANETLNHDRPEKGMGKSASVRGMALADKLVAGRSGLVVNTATSPDSDCRNVSTN